MLRVGPGSRKRFPAALAAFWFVVGDTILGFGLMLYEAAVLRILWGWFLAQYYPAPSVIALAGMLLMTNFLTARVMRAYKPTASSAEHFTAAICYPPVVLLVGALLHVLSVRF